MSAAEIGTWIWEVKHNQVFADQNLARLFNVSEADARGGPLERYMANVHEEDRPRVAGEINRATAEGLRFETEYRVARPEGGYRWVVARGWAERDPATGEAVRFPGVVLDISERHRAQEAAERRSEQLRQLADTSARLNTTLDVPSVLGVITVEARKLIGARHAVTTAAPVGSLQAGVTPLTIASHAEDGAWCPNQAATPCNRRRSRCR